MATDYDCWRPEAEGESVTVEMVNRTMKDNAANAKKFVSAVLDEMGKEDGEEIVEAKHLKGVTKMGLSTEVEGIKKEARERLEWLFPGEYNFEF